MYIIYNRETTSLLPQRNFEFATEAAAKAALTRLAKSGMISNKDDWAIADREEFHTNIEKTKIVKNLMSGEEIEIPVNTPVYMDPSKETYWSM